MDNRGRVLLPLMALIFISSSAAYAQQRCPPFANMTSGMQDSGIMIGTNESSSLAVPCSELVEGQRTNQGILPALNYYCRNVFLPQSTPDCSTTSCMACRQMIACEVPDRSFQDDVCAGDTLLSCSGFSSIDPELDDLYGGLCEYASGRCLVNSTTAVCGQSLLQVCASVDAFSVVWPCDCFLPNGTCELCNIVGPLCANVTIYNGTDSVSGSGSGSGNGSGLCEFVNTPEGSGYPFMCQMLQPGSTCSYSTDTCLACYYLEILGCSYPPVTLEDICSLTVFDLVCADPSQISNTSYLVDLCGTIKASGGCGSTTPIITSGSGLITSGSGSGGGGSGGGTNFCDYFHTEDGIGYLYLCQLIEPGTVCPYSNDTCLICQYLPFSGCTFRNVTITDICAQPRIVGVCETLSLSDRSPFFHEICSFVAASGCETNDTCVGSHCHFCSFLVSDSGLGYLFLCQRLIPGDICPYSNSTCDICQFVSSGLCPDLPSVGYSELCGLSSLVDYCSYYNYNGTQYQAVVEQDPFYSDLCPFTGACVIPTVTPSGGGISGSGISSGYVSGGSSGGGEPVTCDNIDLFAAPGIIYYCSTELFSPQNCSDQFLICTLCNFVQSCPNTTVPTTTEVCASVNTIAICFAGESDFNDYCTDMMSLCLSDMDSGVCELEELIENCTTVLALSDFLCHDANFTGVCDLCMKLVDLCAPELNVSVLPSPSSSYSSLPPTFGIFATLSSSIPVIAATPALTEALSTTSGGAGGVIIPTIELASTSIIYSPEQTSYLLESSSVSAPTTVGIGLVTSSSAMTTTSSAVFSSTVQTVSIGTSYSVATSTVPSVLGPVPSSSSALESFPDKSSSPPPASSPAPVSSSAPSSSSLAPAAPSSSPVSPPTSPPTTTYPEGTAIEVDDLKREQEENTISLEITGISVVEFVSKQAEFRASIATALNDNRNSNSKKRRQLIKRQNDEVTADDVTFVGRPLATSDGAVLVAFFVKSDDDGVVKGSEVVDAVNKNSQDIEDTTGGKVGRVSKGVPEALRTDGEETDEEGGGGGLSGGAIVAIVVLVVIVSLLGVAVILGLLWLIARRRQKKSFEIITSAGDYTDMEQMDQTEEEEDGETGKSPRSFPMKTGSNVYTPVPGTAYTDKKPGEDNKDDLELSAKVTHL